MTYLSYVRINSVSGNVITLTITPGVAKNNTKKTLITFCLSTQVNDNPQNEVKRIQIIKIYLRSQTYNPIPTYNPI